MVEMECSMQHIPKSLHWTILLPSFLLLSSALTSPACAKVNYVLGRQRDPFGFVDKICLGTSTEYAFAYVSDEVPPPEVVDDNIIFNEKKTSSAFLNANYMYIGNSLLLRNQLCATENYIFLYNATTNTFLRANADAFSPDEGDLFGDIGSVSYVSTIWEASKGTDVNLTVQNLLDQDWKLNYSLSTAQDPVIPPYRVARLPAKGSFYDGSLAGQSLLENFTTVLITSPLDLVSELKLGTTYSAILINETTPTSDDTASMITVVYYFFVVQDSKSTWCRSTQGYNCLVGTAFEAQYDARDFDFDAIHCQVDKTLNCARMEENYLRRRLLSDDPETVRARMEIARRKLRGRNQGRRLGTAASSTTKSGSAAVKVCKFTRVSCKLNGVWTTCPHTVCQ